jgi:acyl carrier protein
MNNDEILAIVTSVFKEILDNEQIVLVRETTAGDIEEWDSLSHIQLVVAIEKKFGIRFTSSQIQSWRNVGEMIDNIGDRINKGL